MTTACATNTRDTLLGSTGTWQYLTHRVSVEDLASYEGQMAVLGAAGWELVSATPLSIGKRLFHQAGDTNTVLMVYKRRATADGGR